MSANWGFYNPTHIHFRPQGLAELTELVDAKKTLLITTPGSTRRGVSQKVKDAFGGREIRVYDEVTPNPALHALQNLADELKNEDFDLIIGLGGGSSIDSAKVIAFLLANPEIDLEEFLTASAPEKTKKPRPVIAVPTTAGTGSEVTPFATVWNKQSGKKLSLSTPDLFSNHALMDPTLTTTLPREQTISGGLDALSQCLESIWNKNSNPITFSLAVRGIKNIFETLPELLENPEDFEMRSAVMEAALFSGLAISSTRTALAHSMSYPLTSNFAMPHGLACSFTLPALLAFNSQTDKTRFTPLASALDCNSIRELQKKLKNLLNKLQMSDYVSKYIPSRKAALNLIPAMFTPERAGNNIRPADAGDLKNILNESLNLFLKEN